MAHPRIAPALVGLLALTGLGGCVADLGAAGGFAIPVAARGDTDLRATAPDWRVGDRWEYSDGYGLEVEATGDGLARFRRLDDPTQWLSRRGFLRQDSQSATVQRSVVFRSVAAVDAATLRANAPLVFTREFTANDKTRVHTTSWIVEGRERVSVPAGDFDCIVLVMRTRNPETGWTGFERWWYAPDVRHYVRLEYRYGEGPVASRVLHTFRAGVARQVVQLQKPTALNQADPAAASPGAPASSAPPAASHGPKAIAPAGISAASAEVAPPPFPPPMALSDTPYAAPPANAASSAQTSADGPSQAPSAAASFASPPPIPSWPVASLAAWFNPESKL